MKVPHSVVGRTQPSQEPLGYVSASGAKAFQGLENLGQDIAAFGAGLKQRQQTTEKFSALRSFSDFETAAAQALDEAKRTSAPDDGNFLARAEAIYDDAESKYLAQLPAELQPEFRARGGDLKQKIVGSALDFQYKSQDAFYVKGIDTEYQKGLQALDPKLGGDPSQIKVWKERLNELADTSDLSAQQKADLKSKMAMGLEGVSYKAKVRDKYVAAGGGPIKLDATVSSAIDKAAAKYGEDAKAAKTIAWLESRGDPNAKNKSSSAGGVFQFIDSTARQYGLQNKFDAEANIDAGIRLMADNRKGLKSALGRDPSIGELYLAHQQGLGGALAMLQNPDALAVDVVGYEAVQKNGGAPGMTAQQFANKWINKANAVAGDDIDMDQTFGSLTYEDRVALQEDAERDATQYLTEQKNKQTAVYNSQRNNLYVGLYDGSQGRVALDNAKNTWMNDYDDIAKAESILKAQTDKLATLANFQAKASDPSSIFSPTDEDDKKGYNAWFNQQGPKAFAENNEAYVTTQLVPMAQRTGDISTDTVGMLSGMTRSNDPKRQLYAFNTLAMMQDAASDAFDSRVSDSLASDLQYWRDRKDTTSAEELAMGIKGGTDQAQRQARKVLRTEAQDYLASKEKGIPKVKELVSSVMNEMDVSWSDDPHVSNVPWAAQGLERDFRTAFVDEYERRGNVEEATAAATKTLQRSWAVSSVGGQDNLMKYPPEKVGYKPIAGSYEWIDRQVRAEVGFAPDQKFQLLSDDQTRTEFLGNQRGEVRAASSRDLNKREFFSGTAPGAPSYLITYWDAEGAPRTVLDKNNRPYRIAFEPTAEDKIEDVRVFDRTRAQREYDAFIVEKVNRISNGIRMGVDVTGEMADEEKRLTDRLKATEPPPAPPQSIPDPAPFDALGNATGL